RNNTTVSAFRFLAEPAQMVERHRDLTLALRERLAVFEGIKLCDFFGAFLQFVSDLEKKLAATFGRKALPPCERIVGVGDRLGDDCPAHGAHSGNYFAGGWVLYLVTGLGNMES